MARPEPQADVAERPEAPKQAEKPAEGKGEERNESRPEQEDVAPQSGRNLGDHAVTYAVDQKTREIVARVVDTKSGEVLREFPSEQLRAMQSALRDANKQLFDKLA